MPNLEQTGGVWYLTGQPAAAESVARRGRRRVAAPMTEPAHDTPDDDYFRRYYCPGCGQVANSYEIGWRWGKPIALPHHYVSGVSRAADRAGGQGDSTCPGGPIDTVKDRAP